MNFKSDFMNEEKTYRLPTSDEILKGQTGFVEINRNEDQLPEEIETLKKRVKILEEKFLLLKRGIDRSKPKITKKNLKIKKKIKKSKLISTRKKKIIEIPDELIQKGKFISKNVEDFFKISRMSASRYIKRWIKEGKIKRVGSKHSTKVHYEIISS